MDGVSKHLSNCHTAEIGGQVLSSLYRVLQDLNGRQLEPVSDPIGVFSDNYNLQSYRLLVKKGLIHRGDFSEAHPRTLGQAPPWHLQAVQDG